MAIVIAQTRPGYDTITVAGASAGLGLPRTGSGVLGLRIGEYAGEDLSPLSWG